ncbi:MAG: hypothetical protein VB111_04605 [Clostridiaceae bacterium]|nr:hypothetical protein [Clostridiaceae bacterium]
MRRHQLRATLAIFRIRFAEGFQYRAAALSGTAIGVFWALIEIVVYSCFFKYGALASSNDTGMSLGMTVTYVWLGQAIWPLQSMSIDGDILTKITSGDVGVELVRPLDLYGHWYAKTAAGTTGRAWVRAILTVLIGAVMPAAFRLSAPASWIGLCLFLFSLVLAILLCNAFAMFVTAIRMNITLGEGPTYILMLLSGVLSGGYIPLRLWPAWMQTFLLWQPFGGFTDVPLQCYLGLLSPAEAWPRLGLQLAWTAVFIAGGRILMKRQLRTIIVQGG